MPEILFVTWDGGGNVPPALGIASVLVARGHRVRFLGHEANRAAVETAGFEHEAYATARPFSSLAPGSPFAQLAMFADRGMGRDLLASLRRSPADLVVVDCLLFGAMEALRESGTRYVVLEHLYDAYLRGPWLRGPLGLGMRVRRLRPTRSLAGAEATLVATLPELDPGSRASHAAGLDFVGPVVPPVSPRPDATEPAVLVSLSTYAFPGMAGRLQALLDAAGELDARVVATTGPAIDPGDLRAAPNTELHRFVPHAEVMPAVSLVVGHGGHGTTMQALAHDVPVLVMPMHPFLDQPMVGASVAAAGAGAVVRRSAKPVELVPVLAALLADGPHRAAAARLGAAIRALPGAPNGADRVEALLVSPAPAPGASPRPASS
jgi:UDP:flavonoid glycosyltransferase YjiC (YdhE family)